MVGATGFELWKPNLLLIVANDKASWRQIMSQLASSPTTSPSVEVLPDLFGYCLIVDGVKLYIPKEQLDQVLVGLLFHKVRESPGSEWLAELEEIILAD